MPESTRILALRDRQAEIFTGAEWMNVQTVSVTTAAGTVETRVSLVERGDSANIFEASQATTRMADCVMNRDDDLLTLIRDGDYGTLTDEDGTVWTIQTIKRRTSSIYHVGLTIRDTSQIGRTRRDA
jgi:hypothetical protein